MKTLDQIKNENKDGEFYAIGNNGKQYTATYTTKYGGVMFFVIPSTVEIIGYIER